MSKKKVLFVCLGNICRSPAAEGIFAHLIKNNGLEDKYSWDSAGTSGYHQGEPADARMIEHAKRRGIELPSKSRPFSNADFNDFDLILTMDNINFRDVQGKAVSEKEKNKVKKMVAYCFNFDDAEVPDPYYGGEEGFEHVMDLLEDGCKNLINDLENS